MRKTSADAGGLSEERTKKGRGGRRVDRKGQRQRAMDAINNTAVTSDLPHPYDRETRQRTNKPVGSDPGLRVFSTPATCRR